MLKLDEVSGMFNFIKLDGQLKSWISSSTVQRMGPTIWPPNKRPRRLRPPWWRPRWSVTARWRWSTTHRYSVLSEGRSELRLVVLFGYLWNVSQDLHPQITLTNNISQETFIQKPAVLRSVVLHCGVQVIYEPLPTWCEVGWTSHFDFVHFFSPKSWCNSTTCGNSFTTRGVEQMAFNFHVFSLVDPTSTGASRLDLAK